MPAREADPAARLGLRDVTSRTRTCWTLGSGSRSPRRLQRLGMPRGPTPREVLAKGPLRNERNGALISNGSRMAFRSGPSAGTCCWPNPPSAAWNFRIDLIPEARGGRQEAQRLLAAWLFEHTDVHRVEASTDIGL